jgi:hypothetical protein
MVRRPLLTLLSLLFSFGPVAGMWQKILLRTDAAYDTTTAWEYLRRQRQPRDSPISNFFSFRALINRTQPPPSLALLPSLPPSPPCTISSTIPLVIYPNYLYVYGEFFMRTVATLYAMQARGWIDKRCVRGIERTRLSLRWAVQNGQVNPASRWRRAWRTPAGARVGLDKPRPADRVLPPPLTIPPPKKNRVTLVVATLNMRLEPYHYFLLKPFTNWNVTTLGHFSSRLPLATPEHYNPDGQHVRCFK